MSLTTIEKPFRIHGRVTGGPDPPEKSQKIRVSKQYWSGSPEKSQSYQDSIQCWAIIGPPAKRRFAGGPMMTRLYWYFDPPSPHQLRKWRFAGGPMMTRLVVF